MNDSQRNEAVEFLNALGRGENPDSDNDKAIDYLTSLATGEDIETAKKRRLDSSKPKDGSDYLTRLARGGN